MNLLLDLQINNTVFQNVHQSFIKYIKHTEVINIHLFIKAKIQVFLKELIFHKKGALSETSASTVLFQKMPVQQKKTFYFFTISCTEYFYYIFEY